MQEQLLKWFQQIITTNGAIQFGVLVVCAGIAWYAHLRWSAYIRKRLGKDERKGIWRAAARGSIRVVFPLCMLLMVLVCRGVLFQFDISTPILDVLTPLLLSLAAIQISVFVLRRAYSPSPALRAWESGISIVVWVIVALYLVGWLQDIGVALDSVAISTGDARFSLLSIVELLIASAIFIVAANWLSKTIERKTKRSQHISASMQVGLIKVSKVLLYSVAILIALSSVGIDLTTLTVFGGALGVGLGFGLQRIASNFISGFILLFDRSIKPGDVISVGARYGWVQALHARYVVVRDRDGVETLIPNETLITSEVTNWSYTDKQIRLKLPVQISYADDPEQAMNVLLEASKISSRVLTDPAPQARLLNFGDNGIDLELRIWLEDPIEGTGSIRSDINVEIWRQFKQQGITIPFPQRDVHLIKQPDL